MHSAIYRGWLEHRRETPRRHAFRYPLFMLYLDLAELDTVFAFDQAPDAHRLMESGNHIGKIVLEIE